MLLSLCHGGALDDHSCSAGPSCPFVRVGAFLIVQPLGVLAGIWLLGYVIAMVQWIRSVVVQRLSPAKIFRHGMEVFECYVLFAGGYGCTPQSSVSAGLYSVTRELIL